jgi:glycosyltransferase involved in cell wall biosynthesis
MIKPFEMIIPSVKSFMINILKHVKKYIGLLKLKIIDFRKPIFTYKNIEVTNQGNEGTRKVLFLIYCNNVGGAEYVSYQHIKICKDLGYSPVVLSATKGMFFDKINELNVSLFFCKYDELKPSAVQNVLYTISMGCDVIFNCNNFFITPYVKNLKKYRKFQYITIAHTDRSDYIKELLKHNSITDKYIVIHDKIRFELNKMGIHNTRIITIPNFIDQEILNQKVANFDNRKIKKYYNIDDSDFIVGMVTRISPDKNILDAVKVIKMCPPDNIKLFVIGDAPNTKESKQYKDDVIRYIEELGINHRIIFSGHVDHDSIYMYLSCFNISLNTSPSEGMPISLLEQMGCGIHAVYPSHGGIPEVLTGHGSVINVPQMKTDRLPKINGYVRYQDHELALFSNEILRVYNKGTMDKKSIMEGIKNYGNRKYIISYLDTLYGGYKEGISFIIRARNEEQNIRECLYSILDIADEIIFVDHLSTDNTLKIALELSKRYDKIKVFKYTQEIPKPGVNYTENIKKIGNSISNYYNFCLSKATRNNIIKWDADFIAKRAELSAMIEIYNLRQRKDKFSLWFTGETIFIKGNQAFVNKNSFYDEYRAFSLFHGVHWKDAIRCECIDPQYINSSIKLRYEKPCFYEIKRVENDEFVYRDSLIDKRDIMDNEIIEKLKHDIKDANLEIVEMKGNIYNQDTKMNDN